MPADNPLLLTISASKLATPSRIAALRMARQLVFELGETETCVLISVPSYVMRGWIAGKAKLWPRDKRIIWLIWSLVFKPENYRSLFDVATFGRYLPPSKDTTRAKTRLKPKSSTCGLDTPTGSVPSETPNPETPQAQK